MKLLNAVKSIKTEYDTIAKYTAANFNVFEILGVGTKEVRLHSNFLAELLDPKGSHMQGDLFLKTFLEIFEDKIKWEEVPFNVEDAIVQKEYWTGYITEDYLQGGSIDILVRNNKQGIIIENKIYAEDQEKQLLRYYNYGINTFKSENNFKLLYLTLDGSVPAEFSTANTNNFSCISYQYDIIRWLEKCLTVVYDFPLVFALIRQYLNHIKYLTNQSIFKKMGHEIKNLIEADESSFFAAREISNALLEIRRDLFSKISNHFKTYFKRTHNTNQIITSNYVFDIILDMDKADGHYVGLILNKNHKEISDTTVLREVCEITGGTAGNNIYFTWFSLECIPRNLDSYSDVQAYTLLQDEKLNELYIIIDTEISDFINRFKSELKGKNQTIL